MDKTPAWLNYMTLQAVQLDGDVMVKVNAILSGIFGGGAKEQKTDTAPKNRTEELVALRKLGFKVRRENK